jgi:glutamate dehydrogenase (NADP+)
MLVAEGANMPTVPEAVRLFQDEGVLFAPGKAANAGGVATSGLEMSQNAGHTSWDRNTVDKRLRNIMVDIHKNVFQAAEAHGTPGNYVNGANIAGFLKVATAMLAQGVV